MSDAEFDPREFLPYLLNQAAERSSLAFQHIYKSRYGMLRTEWRVLFHLGIHGEMTASEISAHASLHKTKISRAVARLESRRWLERRDNPGDRRSERLRLTTAGENVYGDLRAAAQRHEAGLTARLGKGDLARLKRLLKRISGDGG